MNKRIKKKREMRSKYVARYLRKVYRVQKLRADTIRFILNADIPEWDAVLLLRYIHYGAKCIYPGIILHEMAVMRSYINMYVMFGDVDIFEKFVNNISRFEDWVGITIRPYIESRFNDIMDHVLEQDGDFTGDTIYIMSAGSGGVTSIDDVPNDLMMLIRKSFNAIGVPPDWFLCGPNTNEDKGE